MFGIIFSNYRAEPDKKNIFLEGSAPLHCQKKNPQTHITLKKFYFSFEPFFYFWSKLNFFFQSLQLQLQLKLI
jgi:hypothetical protein